MVSKPKLLMTFCKDTLLFHDVYAPWTSLAFNPKDYGSITTASDTDCSLACTFREQNGKG